jgi:translation initiation factor 2B subunit (eIF-2B alpha/beta/delta family)
MSSRDDIVELFRWAATDRECGAGEIEQALVGGLLEHGAALEPESLYRGARLLAAGQPAMANLQSLAFAAESADPVVFVEWLQRRIEILSELPQRLAANGWPHLENVRMVATISRSTAVAAVVEGAWSRGWTGSVVVFDGSQSGRGPDQTSRLSRHGTAHSQPDATMPQWLDGEGTIVVVGADGVGPDAFVNAVGTRLLLELARNRGVERILAADSGKNVTRQTFDEMVEVMPAFRDPTGRSWPVFEVIPLDLVTARISERRTNS